MKSNDRIPFGSRCGFSVGRVSIGAMRFPADLDNAVALVRHAIDNGMTYIDTSRCYGESETVLARALKDGYRDKVILSTKWSPWISKIDPSDDSSASCVVRRIEESMRRLEVEYLDFYQVWNIQNRENYEETIRPGGFLEGLFRARERGLIGHLGITSHDTIENLLRYIDEMEWCEVLLVTYNLLNTRYAPVLERAKSKGIGTIVMNPVGGGKLAENSSVFSQMVIESGSRDMADLAIRYVLSNPNIDTVIAGISKTSDVDQCLLSSRMPVLSPDLIEKTDRLVESLLPENAGFCTACRYCMPCPQEVNIPAVMDAIHNQRVLGFEENARNHYAMIGNSWIKGARADACVNCGECVPKCTQKLDIPEQMRYAVKAFETPGGCGF